MSNSKKEIRRQFRDAVFKRDNYKCAICGAVELDAHHITDRNELPNGGYVVENGISLCQQCHDLAEDFHRGNPPQKGFHPNELYIKIGSSRDKAAAASLRLSRK